MPGQRRSVQIAYPQRGQDASVFLRDNVCVRVFVSVLVCFRESVSACVCEHTYKLTSPNKHTHPDTHSGLNTCVCALLSVCVCVRRVSECSGVCACLGVCVW